jgi:fructoselysine-6-P-deglycase FrlB-like protein
MRNATIHDSALLPQVDAGEILASVWVTRRGDAVGFEEALRVARQWVVSAEREGAKLLVAVEGEAHRAAGRLSAGDVVLAVAGSNPAPELLALVTIARSRGCRVVTLTAHTTRHALRDDSELDFFVPSRDPEEVASVHGRLAELLGVAASSDTRSLAA